MNPHHGKEPFEIGLAAALAAAVKDGVCDEQYPAGQIAPSDQGAVGTALAAVGDRVIIHFAKPCHWVGMSGNEAMLFAQGLIDKARQAGLDGPATITIGGENGD